MTIFNKVKKKKQIYNGHGGDRQQCHPSGAAEEPQLCRAHKSISNHDASIEVSRNRTKKAQLRQRGVESNENNNSRRVSNGNGTCTARMPSMQCHGCGHKEFQITLYQCACRDI